MSRIQNILEKAEREGTAMRTANFSGATAAAPPVTTMELPVVPAAASLPVVQIPQSAVALPTVGATTLQEETTATESFSVRLNPLLVAGLSRKSLAAEQYRQLRTRLAHTEGASNL